MVVEQLADSDMEVSQFLQRLIDSNSPNYHLDEVLQLNRGYKRIYLIEN
jgi:hypothetical protein